MSDMLRNLDQLDITRTDSMIRVRVTRTWPTTGNNEIFQGMNMILLDKENYHVHAYARSDHWNLFENVITVGNIYEMKNFVTREATGNLRPVSSSKAILLTNLTTVNRYLLEDNTIPRHKFEIVELGDVYNIASSYGPTDIPEYAIDIVGVVQNIEPPQVLQTRFFESVVVQLHLYDGRNTVKVNVWNEQIASLHPLFEGQYRNPPIVVFSSMRPRVIFGRLQVSSCSSSKIFINIDYDAVRRVSQRLLVQVNDDNPVTP